MNKAFESVSQVFGWSLATQCGHSCDVGSHVECRAKFANIKQNTRFRHNDSMHGKLIQIYHDNFREMVHFMDLQLFARYWHCKSVFFSRPNMAGTNTENGNNQNACIKLESVDRISKLPVVESTLQIGKSVYDKVKDYNSVTNWTITTAESTVCKAVEAGKPYASPVVHSFEGPIKKVDGMICSGLDYVESKIPAVKLPPNEIYNSTKGYIDNSPTVQTAKGYVEPAVETAKSTVQGAKSMVEPALESAKKKVGAVIEQAEHMVEPYMNSSMEKATAIKEYGTQKIEQYLHTSSKNGDNKDQLEEDEEEESPVPRTECSTEVQKR